MNAPKTQESTWGQPLELQDIRALRRYNWLLRKVALAGEILMHGLTILMIVLSIGMLFFGNFENAIFSDGTSTSCMIDGSTGEIVNVQ